MGTEGAKAAARSEATGWADPLTGLRPHSFQDGRPDWDVLEDDFGVPYPEEIQQVFRWWMSLAFRDAAATAPKAVEYSAIDLAIMGDAMKRLIGWDDASVAEGIELALAFYELGKVARAIGALAEHRLPAKDTWDDIRIYAIMAARVREVGGWPN